MPARAKPSPPRKGASSLDSVNLHLIRVLHTVLSEGSVTRAALRLGMQQPSVSLALRKLRKLTGDPLLVRHGTRMVPTEVGREMMEPAAELLRAAESLLLQARQFDPHTSTRIFRIAASDYLDPLFLPMLVTDLRKQAPGVGVEIHALTRESDYRSKLAQGAIDLVIGNWLRPPEDLHMARLFSDEVVSLVSRNHPAARRGFDRDDWLAAAHIAPMPNFLGARGVIDQVLDEQGLQRNIVVRSTHFGSIPSTVASSTLMFTTGRQYCERVLQQLPLAIIDCPIQMPPMLYYQLWHPRSQHSSAGQWLRDRVRSVAAELPPPHPYNSSS